MPSTPVFPSLRIDPGTSFQEGSIHYLVDLVFTLPAYLVITSVIWFFIRRYEYSLWHYVLAMGLGQALGDGGLLYFLNAPGMLVFLPYPMTNYHAMNVIPFLAVRADLTMQKRSRLAYLAVPALIATYFVLGALIRMAGRAVGLA